MPTIPSSDIIFLLSGGASNSNPSLSLGGQASSTPVSGSINSLFSDVTASAAEAGLTDYRCFYIKNNSPSYSLYQSSVHVHAQSLGGSFADLGVQRRTEVQEIQVVGPVSSGSVEFSLDDISFSAEWGGSAASFLSSLASSLAAAGLGDISVSSSSSGDTHTFSLSFLGSLNNKSHPLVEVVDDSLVGVPGPSVSVSRQTAGAPVNTVAPSTPTPSTPPSGVSFSESSPAARISIGTLGPGDSMPVWVRRTTPPGTSFKESDSLTIRLSGNPLPPDPSSSSSGGG